MKHPRPHGWFRRHANEFIPIVQRFAGKPICYVEVGTWTGDSAEWVAAHILTHKHARGHGIDPYLFDVKHSQEEVDSVKQRAWSRLSGAMDRGQWRWWYEDSKKVLRDHAEAFAPIDILYLDGSHDAWDIVQDFSLAWPMLKSGSVVIFDDLTPLITRHRHTPHVKEAFEAIQLAWGNKLNVLNYGPKQGAVQVVSK